MTTPAAPYRTALAALALAAAGLAAPSISFAQQRDRLQNQEWEWSGHAFGDETEAVVFSRDGTRSVAVVRQADGIHVVEGAVPEPPADAPKVMRSAAATRPDEPAKAPPPAKPAYRRLADSPAYEEVARGTPLVSGDGRHVAYAARRRGWFGDRWYFVKDGEPQGPYARVWAVTAPADPTATWFAFVAEQDDHKPFVVVDLKEGKPFDAVDDATLVFSPDGGRIAYAGRRDGRWRAVVDGKDGQPYESVGRPVFSGDGAHVAYAARREGKDVVVLDDREVDARDANARPVRDRTLALSFDGRRYAYAAGPRGAMTVVLDGAEQPAAGPGAPAGKPAAWDMVLDGSIVFSPDGRRVAFSALRDDRWRVVVDGAEGPPYAGVTSDPAVFSPDSQRVAYVAERVVGNRVERLVVADGVEGKPYPAVPVPPAFSLNSKHFTYVADRGGERAVVVDGLEGRPYFCVCGRPVLSNDGTHVVYTAVAGDDRFEAVAEVPADPNRPQAGARFVVDRAPAYFSMTPGDRKRPLQLLLVEERIVQD